MGKHHFYLWPPWQSWQTQLSGDSKQLVSLHVAGDTALLLQSVEDLSPCALGYQAAAPAVGGMSCLLAEQLRAALSPKPCLLPSDCL